MDEGPIDPVSCAGFFVQRIVEPRPQPVLICVRALKPPLDAGRLLGGA